MLVITRSMEKNGKGSSVILSGGEQKLLKIDVVDIKRSSLLGSTVVICLYEHHSSGEWILADECELERGGVLLVGHACSVMLCHVDGDGYQVKLGFDIPRHIDLVRDDIIKSK